MTGVLRLLLIAAAFIVCSECYVEFVQSMLYDEYDIWQSQTTNFVKEKMCKDGCSVYASIPDNENTRKAAKNVLITDGTTEKTLFDVAALYDEKTTQKKSLDFPALKQSLMIRYTGNVQAGPVLIYVISKSGSDSNIPFEVYEARTMNRPTGKAQGITILSPEPFTVGAGSALGGASISAHLGGWDSTVGYGGLDQCAKAFEFNDPSHFPGFELNVQTPMLSLFIGMQSPITMYTRMEYSPVTNFGLNQFVSSPGFTGCYGMEVYRSSLYKDFVDHTITADSLKHITVDATLNTGDDHPVELQDMTNNKKFSFWGDNIHQNAQQTVVMDSKLLHISWTKEAPRSAFLLRFTVSEYTAPPPTTTFDPMMTTSNALRVSLSISTILLLLGSLLG